MNDCDHSTCTGKLCKTCNEPKLTCEFFPIGTTGRFESSCKQCRSKSASENRRARSATPVGREQNNAYARDYRAANPEKIREINLRNIYGITTDDYERKLKEQDGRCAICRTLDPGPRSEFFHVDHDHRTNTLRGLLCHNCNLMLGHAKDTVTTLANAISYLDYYRQDGGSSH